MKNSSSSYAVVRRHVALTQLFVFIAGMLFATLSSHAGTFTVTNTNDSGNGSLRKAIDDANGAGGADTIVFAIPGAGPHTIAPITPLPTVTDPVTINGYSQSGSKTNTSSKGWNGDVRIVLEGQFSGSGLTIDSSGNKLRGLQIQYWNYGVEIVNGDNNAVEGCIINENSAGVVQFGGSGSVYGGSTTDRRNRLLGNGYGLQVMDSTNTVIRGNHAYGSGNAGVLIGISDGTVIGGPDVVDANYIYGNNYGIRLYSFSGNLSHASIDGNWIGVDETGEILGNSYGISCFGTVTNHIGNLRGNVIAGSYNTSLYLQACEETEINGNIIGMDPTGTQSGQFQGIGIDAINNGSMSIGEEEGNLIGFHDVGIRILGDSAVEHTVRGNQFIGRNQQPIDLVNGGQVSRGITPNDGCDPDTGANTLLNYPVLSSAIADASTVMISGVYSGVTARVYTLDFFANGSCATNGHGAGEVWIGSTNVTTGGSCSAPFTVTFPSFVPNGFAITSIATDPDGNTSEFSACQSVAGISVPCECVISPSSSVGVTGQVFNASMVVTAGGSPAEAVVTDMQTLDGPHGGQFWGGFTGINGAAAFRYTGYGAGTDTLRGIAYYGGQSVTCTATRVWSDNPNAPLEMIFPNGGETLVAGIENSVQWQAPTNAASFKLDFSINNGSTWSMIASNIVGQSYDWTPSPSVSNLDKCRMRVTAYRPNGSVWGTDTSDGVFSVSVLDLNYPNGGDTFGPGQGVNASWYPYLDYPSASNTFVDCSFDGGTTWTNVGVQPGPVSAFTSAYLDFVMPTLANGSTQCLARVQIKDGIGTLLAEDQSDSFFTLNPPPPDLYPVLNVSAFACTTSGITNTCTTSGTLALHKDAKAYISGSIKAKLTRYGVLTKLKATVSGLVVKLKGVPQHQIGVYISADNVLDWSDLFVKSVSTKDIKALAVAGKPLVFSGSIPSWFPVSGKYIILSVDDQFTVFESDENNNLAVLGPIP